MHAVYCPQELLLHRIAARLPDSARRVLCTGWPEFRRRSRGAECAIIALPFGREDGPSRVADWKLQHPAIPVVLIVRKDAEVARRLKDLVVEEVLWFRDLDASLPSAIQRARAAGFFRRLAREIERSTALMPNLRAALRVALRRFPPVASVQALGEIVDKDTRTLSSGWRSHADAAGLSLKRPLDCVLVLRGLSLTSERTWESVAQRLGAGERTLRRAALRTTGRRLRDLGPTDFQLQSRRFEHILVSFRQSQAVSRGAERAVANGRHPVTGRSLGIKVSESGGPAFTRSVPYPIGSVWSISLGPVESSASF